MTTSPGEDTKTFLVDTRFQQMARRPGGIPRSRALQNAEVEIANGKPKFEAWLDQELGELADLIQVARSGAAEVQWPDQMRGHSCQMRDIGTTMGFPLLTFIAAHLCNILDNTNAGDQLDLDSIACHVDSLLLARRPEYRSLRPDQLPDLSEGLRQIVASASISPGK
jgi:hypothetical protein